MDRGSRWSVSRIILRMLFIMLCIVLIYLIIDFGSDASVIISSYTGLQNDSKSDFSKSLQFLRTYTQTTGDITLALNTGMTKEEIDEMLEEGNPNDDSGLIGGGGSGGGNNPPEIPELSGTLEEQVNALKASGTYAAYYREVLNVTAGYYWEKQCGKNKIYAGAVTNTIGGDGCFVYAICQAKTNLSGTVFTTVDLVNSIMTNGSVGITGDVVAGNSGRQRVGQGGNGFLFSDAGLDVQQLSAASDIGSKSSSELYIIFGYSSGTSGTHWRVCTGQDSSGNVFILPNSKEPNGKTVNINDMYNYTHNADNLNNARVYRVTL